jgi:hypothetical protein
MCSGNMKKNYFKAVQHGSDIGRPDTRTAARSAGARLRSGRGVTVSYQAQSPVLGLVLPQLPVYTLWLP